VSKYSPLDAIKRTTRAMNSYMQKHERPALQLHDTKQDVGDVTLVATEPGVCVVLLKSLTEGHKIVPDDLQTLRTGTAIKNHTRPDGAVYLGAFDLQNTPESTVLVYGPASLAPEKVERLATLERPALMRRHAMADLGPFANHSTPPLSA
jgi:hypothetical protein